MGSPSFLAEAKRKIKCLRHSHGVTWSCKVGRSNWTNGETRKANATDYYSSVSGLHVPGNCEDFIVEFQGMWHLNLQDKSITVSMSSWPYDRTHILTCARTWKCERWEEKYHFRPLQHVWQIPVTSEGKYQEDSPSRVRVTKLTPLFRMTSGRESKGRWYKETVEIDLYSASSLSCM